MIMMMMMIILMAAFLFVHLIFTLGFIRFFDRRCRYRLLLLVINDDDDVLPSISNG